MNVRLSFVFALLSLSIFVIRADFFSQAEIIIRRTNKFLKNYEKPTDKGSGVLFKI